MCIMHRDSGSSVGAQSTLSCSLKGISYHSAVGKGEEGMQTTTTDIMFQCPTFY